MLVSIIDKIKNDKIILIGTRKIDVISCIKSLDSKKCFNYREREILSNLTEVIKKKDVPSNYLIYEFYDAKGNGFEAGYTPKGMGVTN